MWEAITTTRLEGVERGNSVYSRLQRVDSMEAGTVIVQEASPARTVAPEPVERGEDISHVLSLSPHSCLPSVPPIG